MWGTLGVRLLSRVTMLALAFVSQPGLGLESMQRSHCARHESGALSTGSVAVASHTHLGTAPRAWGHSHQQECPHCPASECGRLAPCAGPTTTAPSSAGGVIVALRAHRVPVALGPERATSASSLPSTPPPQPIA